MNGVSLLSYTSYYDERHAPQRMRRPWSGDGVANPGTGWFDRPDHDALYPEIAVPLELVPSFSIAAGQNQSIWVDVYVPKTAWSNVVRFFQDISTILTPFILAESGIILGPFAYQVLTTGKTTQQGIVVNPTR